eukprot:scaffold5874_cov153-Skeletonema_dohrnii-CCMP3373.AAC.2
MIYVLQNYIEASLNNHDDWRRSIFPAALPASDKRCRHSRCPMPYPSPDHQRSDASFATPPSPPPPQNKNDENQPITTYTGSTLDSGTMAEVITCIPPPKKTTYQICWKIYSPHHHPTKRSREKYDTDNS